MNSSTIASYLSRDYGLADPIEVRFLERGANESCIVESRGQKYIYRIYIENEFYLRNPQTFLYELELLSFLREYQLPVPRPVRRWMERC